MRSGWNSSSASSFSPDTSEHDGLARHALDRERSAATCITVELGEDHAVEVDPLGEGLRRVDRVLAGHGIDDHEDLVGPDGGLDRLGLVHHLLVDMQPSRRVDDDDVTHGGDGLFDGRLGDGHGIAALCRVDRDVEFLAERHRADR